MSILGWQHLRNTAVDIVFNIIFFVAICGGIAWILYNAPKSITMSHRSCQIKYLIKPTVKWDWTQVSSVSVTGGGESYDEFKVNLTNGKRIIFFPHYYSNSSDLAQSFLEIAKTRKIPMHLPWFYPFPLK